MARYIDADKLTVKLNETQIESYKNYYGLGKAKQIVDNVPTANVVERKKIDKAIEEIIEKSFISDIYNDRTDDEIIKVDDVVEILKRNIER